MTFYTRIDDDTLVVTKSTADSSAAVWTKNLPDLTLNTLEDTFLSTDAENKYRLFLWQPVDQNILMVFSKAGSVKCILADENAAHLRLIERINEAVSVSLNRNGLDIRWAGGIVNPMDVQISDAAVNIGNRLTQPFNLPVFPEKSAKNVSREACMHHFHFSLQDLMESRTEIHSRITISLHINGYEVTYPMKIKAAPEADGPYRHVPVTSFYADQRAVQLKYSPNGNIIFICRPMAKIEYSRRFRFWESTLVSGALYHLGRFFKHRSPKKIALFYEKFCEKAEEGTWEIFQEAEQKNPGHAYFLINRDSADYERLKENPRVVPQFSAKYYWLLFRASSYISTEAPTHLSVLRSNNRYFRKSIADNAFIFLQHGITYLKCQGKNSTFVYGREAAPSYIIVDSEKEKNVIARMLMLTPDRILKTGMAIFSKIPYRHLTQASPDIAVIMLTWKPYEDAAEDFTQTSYYKNTMGIYEILRRYLPADHIKIVIHPKTNGHLENTSLASSIWTQPISEVLGIAKLLITDYSSVCYNSFYQGGGVVFFQEDLELYEKENGKLIPADDEYIGRRAFSFEELEAVLEDGFQDGSILLDYFRTEEFERRYQTINEFSDGKNIERICDSLRELELM